jgi:formylglycine-generating enzyme required for sulfatase activity
MGAPEGEEGRSNDEGPQHPVTIAEPFFMAKYPITQAQWRVVAAMGQVERELALEPSNFKGDNRPVETITWLDAVEFCARLSHHTGRDYRLPTEAEWEYACRAGTTTPFHFGETITTDLANYRGTDWQIGETTYPGAYGDGPYGEYREETTEVGSFEVANAFGLYDMHSNVLEWCQDWWHENYEGAPNDGSAWLAHEDDAEEKRVLRGGSWYDVPADCRSAVRGRGAPDYVYGLVGFRVVCGGA